MGFLKKVVKGVGNVAKKALPAVAPALSFVPGIGGVTASAITFAANKTAKKSTPPPPPAPAYTPSAPAYTTPAPAYIPPAPPKAPTTPAAQPQAAAKGIFRKDPEPEPEPPKPEPKFMDKAMAFIKKNWVWVLVGAVTSVTAVILIRKASGGKKTSQARINAARRARAAKAAKARQTKKR